MNREKGLAYCGLACCVCSENENCPGCRMEGCKDKNWCKNFNCCRKKGLHGCFECDQFPCKGGMLDKVRIRAFAAYIKDHGENALMDCLERNEKAGIVYHYKGQLVGDYDKPDTIEGIISLIENGAGIAKEDRT